MLDAHTGPRGDGLARRVDGITIRLRAAGKGDVCAPTNRAVLDKWRNAYNNLVSDLARHFGRESDWWFVPLSARDHFGSRLQDQLQLAAALEEALNDSTRELVIVCKDGLFASALSELAAKHGCRVERSLRDRCIWGVREVRRRVVNFARLLLRVARTVRDWRAGRRQRSWAASTTTLDTIIVAPLHLPMSIGADGTVRDTYFGELPARFARLGGRVAVTGPALCNPLAHATAARDVGRVPVIALDSMITLADVMVDTAGAVYRWLRPPRVPERLETPLAHIGEIVQREIEDAIVCRVHGAQLERAFHKLLERSPSARVLHTYENNWWERAIDRPATARADAPPTTGYLHCAVLESSLKNLRRRSESARPQPHRIVCTGPAARDMLQSLGEYDEEMVLSGCALRAPDLDALPRRQGAVGPVRNILVLLEGLHTMVGLVRLVAAAAPALDGRRIVIRPHPVLPLEGIVAKAGVSLTANGTLQPSSGAPLLDEIAAADVVVFKASSSAFIAGYVGVPLIRYRDDWWLSDDPLRGCTALKTEITQADELAGAVKFLEAMTADQIDEQRALFRAYMDRYLARPSDATLAPFLT